MVDSTLIMEINENVTKTRGRPKKYKTPEDLEKDRIKRNQYQVNYHKTRSEIDPVYAENYRLRMNERTKRYAERNKEKNKLKNQELVMKSKLYDELVKNISVMSV